MSLQLNFLSSVQAVTTDTPLVTGAGTGYLYYRSKDLQVTRKFSAAMLYYRNRSHIPLQVVTAYWRNGSAAVTPITGQNQGYADHVNRYIAVKLIIDNEQERINATTRTVYFKDPFSGMQSSDKVVGSFYYGSLVAANYMLCRDTGTGAQLLGRYNAFCSECTVADPLFNSALNEITPLEVKIANSGISASGLTKIVIKTMITEIESPTVRPVYNGVWCYLKAASIECTICLMSIFNTAFEMYAHCKTQLIMVPEVLAETPKLYVYKNKFKKKD